MGSGGAASDLPIEELCLTVRCYNALKRGGIDTIGQLEATPELSLMSLQSFTPRNMHELREKLEALGLTPWDGPRSVRGRSRLPAALQRPGWLSAVALRAAGVLLPAAERDRWVEEWTAELQALRRRRARARFVGSLLLGGGRRLAVVLRQVWPGERPAWPPS
jgi:hypothetical protein